MQNNGIKIICRFCKEPYLANKKTRTHCRKTSCRSKEIKYQLEMLKDFIGIFCKNKIEATIEIRLPGNDKLSPEAKIDSFNILGQEFNEKNTTQTGGILLGELINYFEPLLWKSVRGNFIIKIFSDGKVDPKVLSQVFTPIESPIIIGNNLIVTDKKTF